MPNDADTQSEKLVEPSHPFRVAPGQVVVDGNDVNAFASEGVQVRGQRGDQRLSFTGLHLGDLALVQRISTDELHVEVPHVQDSFAGFTRYRECFGKDVVQRGTVLYALFEFGGLRLEIGIGKTGDPRFESVDRFDRPAGFS